MTDEKPAIPKYFPTQLKELVQLGWSKEPKERPQVVEFKSSLKEMLIQEKSYDMFLDPKSTSQSWNGETGQPI